MVGSKINLGKIMKPICMKCRKFYRPKRNGTYFTEMMPGLSGGWRPYKIWMGDLWICKGCGHEIIVGVGRDPLCEHYEDMFKELREGTRADEIEINDC
jgi:hypothetical protein